jgi:Ig-like domain from next to BRCA1 gene/Bacterial Ig domain
MKMKRQSFSTARWFLIGLFFAATLLACDLGGGSKPTVVISSPPSGSTFHEGDEVAVQSTSADASGVTRVELTVDGAVVRNDAAPSAQTNFSIVQTWKATQGTHTIAVRAYNAAGTASDPAAISIQVGPSVAQNNTTPTATSTTAPGAPTNTSVLPTSTSPAPSACANNSAFVTDVNVPDGTSFSAGQTFNKIWRMSNSGTCAWGSGYQFVFVSGEAMTSSTVVSAPATAPGATADILVPMTAPAAAGNHAGSWRMRGADGTLFGSTVTVKITVPGAPPPPSGCSGNPVIASFTVASATITAGSSTTLNWGAVTNADSVEIDHGIGGVAAPGSTSVSPGSTTTYTMTAHCSSNTTTAQVTVTVVPPLPPPVAVIYDFIAKANAGSDQWQGYGSMGTFNLPFPDVDTDQHGFALWRYNSKLNDGSQPAQVLETHPQWVANGGISRCYRDLWNTGYKIQASDHLSGKVGFLQGASAGDVTFRVRLRTDSFPNNDIVVQHLAYADGVKSFNIALGTINSGQYVGHQADACLIVEAGASSSQDWAVWQNVIITR